MKPASALMSVDVVQMRKTDPGSFGAFCTGQGVVGELFKGQMQLTDAEQQPSASAAYCSPLTKPSAMAQNYYDILGITRDATAEEKIVHAAGSYACRSAEQEVKKAYKKAALTHHPDKVPLWYALPALGWAALQPALVAGWRPREIQRMRSCRGDAHG